MSSDRACRFIAASLQNSRLCKVCLLPFKANARSLWDRSPSISARMRPNSSISRIRYFKSSGASRNWLQQSLIVIIDSVTWAITVANVMALETTPTTSAIAINKQHSQIQISASSVFEKVGSLIARGEEMWCWAPDSLRLHPSLRGRRPTTTCQPINYWGLEPRFEIAASKRMKKTVNNLETMAGK